MGIGKRELLTEYYLDEFFIVLDAYAELRNPKRDGEAVMEVGAEDW